MTYVTSLRDSITNALTAKENGREAGAGIWAYYVRATMDENPARTVDEFDLRHKALMAELEALAPMSKQDKSSLASAKCVVKGAVGRGIDVWKRGPDGQRELSEAGEPMPRGKSDLQESKTDFEIIMQKLASVTKALEADEREPFNKEQLDSIANALLVLAENVAAESRAIGGSLI